MKHYLAKDGTIWAFEEDGSQDDRITPDLRPLSDQELKNLRNPVPTKAQIMASFTAAIQDRLDSFAKTRGYDGILSACTYASSAVPRFASEGGYCVRARDDTWAAAYQMLAEVEAGARPMPTFPEVEAELPALEWP